MTDEEIRQRYEIDLQRASSSQSQAGRYRSKPTAIRRGRFDLRVREGKT